jgi:hypothetical protein
MALPKPTTRAGGTWQVRCYNPDEITVAFDDQRLVTDAGLLLPATLAVGLGLRELLNAHVDLGEAPGRANVGDKAMTVVHALLAGGSWIDDCDRLRAGATGQVTIQDPAKPESTLASPLAKPMGSWLSHWPRVGAVVAGTAGVQAIQKLPGRRTVKRPIAASPPRHLSAPHGLSPAACSSVTPSALHSTGRPASSSSTMP